MSEMFSILGEASGATSGDFPLESDLWKGSVTEIRIPISCKAKIWTKRIAGDAVVAIIKATRDITVETPTWYNRDVQKLASAGELSVDKRKPIIITGRTGKEAIRVSWDELASGAVSNFEGEIEIEGEKDG